MNRILVVLVSIFSVVSASAASKSKGVAPAFAKGSAVLDLTIGTPTNPGLSNRKVIMPPASLVLDFGAISVGKKKSTHISFGGMASYYIDDMWGSKVGYRYGGYYYHNSLVVYDAEVHNVFVAFRAAAHHTFVEKMDLYAGLLMGGHWRRWDYVSGSDYYLITGNDPIRSKFCFGPFLGMRYFVAPAFGFKAEFGVDTGAGFPYAQAGISFKMK